LIEAANLALAALAELEKQEKFHPKGAPIIYWSNHGTWCVEVTERGPVYRTRVVVELDVFGKPTEDGFPIRVFRSRERRDYLPVDEWYSYEEGIEE
jgi:hypothetical protein